MASSAPWESSSAFINDSYSDDDEYFLLGDEGDDGGAFEAILVTPAEYKIQNLIVLGVIFTIALLGNLFALPVILFKRTKFGNGLFAVLILCLTASDVAVTFFSILGSLIIEGSHFLWGGAPGSCQVYHWLSAWLTGLSAYLLVSIVGMVMVKTTNSCLQRLRDCRWLLLAILLISGLYALPELFIRNTVTLSSLGVEQDMCLLGIEGPLYFLYMSFRILIRHFLPAILVIATILRPETKLSKRVSHLFFGHISVPCSCGENGTGLGIPHECPSMQSAMLKSTAVHLNANGVGTSTSLTGSARPDLLADSEPVGCIAKGSKLIHRLQIQPEDPHRRKYKLVLSMYFLFVTFFNVAIEIAFQIQSSTAKDEIWMNSEDYINHGDNLATAILCFSHFQQIGDPIIFLIIEFLCS
ncbi:unnamed protein product [Lepeophtheirus salmonis]|uniref:(salmon louse) hypothetical protein n=1 Tax=Lepeophtheirus salmonis TaxID=72036 RepID=A0A7R8CVH4_LEPSM|nr:unnamed protein product [Lepeophtheirus salmonis]CAF2944884.1 unnamed protein product [Lepeophtheirus salmonis]